MLIPFLAALLLLLAVTLVRSYWLHRQVRSQTEELRLSEIRYRNLVERLPAIIYTFPYPGASVPYYLSPQVESLLGYHASDLINDPGSWSKLIHPEDRHWVLAVTARHEADSGVGTGTVGQSSSRTQILEYRAITRDGRIVWLRDEAVTMLDRDGRPLHRQGIITDITERKETEGKLHRQIQRIAALRLIDMAINSSVDLSLTLRILLEQAISLLGADAGTVLLVNSETRQLECGVATGFRKAPVQETRLGLGQGYAGQAALRRRLVRLSCLDQEAGMLFRTPGMAEEGFITYYGMPLLAKGEIKGVLELFFRTPFTSDSEWMNFLEALAGQAAIAIDNAGLVESLQRANASLMTAYDDTISGWARALELRDGETEGHSRRVMEVVVDLARELGCSEEELVQIRRGALLHDIGKMGIPDHILLKPGRLTDTEWQIMRRHPVYSYEMLASIDFLRPALDIPYCHHERWDGRGYPRGLEGEQIPLPARIFALVDVWDALRSDRPYRPAWPEEKVDQYLQQEAGRHFDPRIVDLFFHYIKRNKRVKQETVKRA